MRQALLWEIAIAAQIEAEGAVTALLETVTGLTPAGYRKPEAPRCIISVYTPAARDQRVAWQRRLTAGLRALQASGFLPPGSRLTTRRLPPQNWAHSWKRHFRPIEIGPNLLVKPAWSRRRPRAGQKEIIINPGLSFGTGQHATTRYCLEQIASSRAIFPHGSLLDVGTGSGILAIAAARLGYDPVAAWDYDPMALKTAGENAARNHLKIRFARKDVLKIPPRSKTKYHLICANLSTDLLLGTGVALENRMAKGGRLVVAGILDREFPGLVEFYAALGLKLTRQRREKEWRSGMFRRE